MVDGEGQAAGVGTEVGSDPAGVIVLVGGFLAPRGDAQTRGYWGEALANVVVPPGWRVVVAHPSPVASLHDRACQLFYRLKGGPTYYGLAHAAEHGHAAVDPPGGASSTNERTGLHPNWSAEQPVHFIAHSLGGNTVRFLLQLMREGNECLRYSESRPGDLNTSADAAASYPTSAWVRSITCLCSPINGGPAVYGLGGDPHGSSTVRWGSGGFCLSAAIALVEGSKAVGLPWRQQTTSRKGRPNSSSSSSCCSERSQHRAFNRALKACACSLATPPAPPAMDFGLAHFFQRNRIPGVGHNSSLETAAIDAAGNAATAWDQHYDWLVRAVRFLWGLLQFALPWPLGASAAGKGHLEHGFAVFSTPDNLAYDVQVGVANAVNRRIAATAMAAEAAATTIETAATVGSHVRECSSGNSSGGGGDDKGMPPLIEDPHTFLFSVVGTQRKSSSCGLSCPCRDSSTKSRWNLGSLVSFVAAALVSLTACLARCFGAVVEVLVSEVRAPRGQQEHCSNGHRRSKSVLARALEAAYHVMWGAAAAGAKDVAGWFEGQWDTVNVQSVAAVGWAMQCSYEHLRRGEPKLTAYPPDVRAIVAGFADSCSISSSSMSGSSIRSGNGSHRNRSRSVTTNGSAGGTTASSTGMVASATAGPNGHDGVCPAKSQSCPWLGPGMRSFSAVNLNAAAAAAASSAAAPAADAQLAGLRTEHSEQEAQVEPRLKPGAWHYETLPCDHLGLVTAPRCPHAQRRFFRSLYQRLYALDQHLAMNGASAATAPPLPATLSWLEPPALSSSQQVTPPNLTPPPPVATAVEGRQADRLDIFPYRSGVTAKWPPHARTHSPKGVEESPTSSGVWAHSNEFVLP